MMPLAKCRGQIILLIDVCLIFTFNSILFLPHLMREDIRLINLVLHVGLLTFCSLIFQLAFKTYNSLWRYAESREYLLLLTGMSLGFLTYSVINLLIETNTIWISQALTGTALALLAMLGVRFLYRMYRRTRTGRRGQGRRYVAIVGAGTLGVSLLHELQNTPEGRFLPYCLLDDAPDKIGKRISGVPVLGPIATVQELLQDTPVSEIIFAIQNMENERRARMLHLCASTGCQLHIPDDPLKQVQSGRSATQMRAVRVEDLLGRDPICLDNPRLAGFLRDKTVLVTGGGGSIGSELCCQIAEYRPRRLVVLDIAENSVYELQNNLMHLYGGEFPLSVEIASVRDQRKMEQLFAQYQPNIVFHAAAHKHVPLMEHCPEEAVKNNVFGTYYAALAARKYGAEKFVLISTDKAVNPTNIMGTTKYLCEQVIQGLRDKGKTEFAAVRFGNVLGSEGSVIPLFEKQIAYGGPVTITDKRIIRYFMTIPEAAQLVLEAGSFAHNGEVFVLDMGEPVHILDLAEKLIRLSGYIPYTEIPIQEIGLRPGEKLYEELLTDNAGLRHTENRKILVEERPKLEEREMVGWLEALSSAMECRDREEIFRVLHALVPTFRTPEEVNSEAIAGLAEETAQREEQVAVAV